MKPRTQRKAERAGLVRDMAAVAALLADAGGVPLPASKLVGAMAVPDPTRGRARLRTFCAEGWIDPAEPRSGDWMRGEGAFLLGFVRLWLLEFDELAAAGGAS